MSFGWSVAYTKGPAAWFPMIQEYYGQWFFVGLAFIAAILGAIKSSRRLLYVLILTWSVPYALYVLFVIVIKPSHFLLPITLPLFSCLAYIMPFDGVQAGRSLAARWLSWGAVALIALQFVSNLSFGCSAVYGRALPGRDQRIPEVLR